MSTDDDETKDTSDKQKRLQEQKQTFERLHQMFINEMSKGKTSHDVIFKYIMEKPEVVTAYLQAEMPKPLVDNIKWDTLTYEPTNLGSPMVNEKRADILLSLRLKSTEKMYVYFMFAHQSTDVHSMAWRFYEYLYLWYSNYIKTIHNGKFPHKLPFVFPLVLYNGLKPWESPTSLQNLIDVPIGCTEYSPQLSFHLRDLSQTDDAEIQRQYAQSFLLAKFAEYFKYSRHPSFYDRLLVDEQFILLKQESGDTLLSIYLYIIQTYKGNEPISKMLDNKLRTENDMIDLIKQWKDEGINEGIERGREEGREEGQYQKAIETAQNLIQMGLSDEQIAQATGLPIEQVKDLR